MLPLRRDPRAVYVVGVRASLPRIRNAVGGDVPFMWDMLYEAALVAPEIRALSKEAALARPDVARWLDGWGRDGDIGVIASNGGGDRAGAAWARIYTPGERGLGIVAWSGVPELSIGVRADVRRRGVGASLLAALKERLHDAGVTTLVLSVDPSNPAVRLYRRCGFARLDTDDPALGTSLLMRADLRS